MRTIYKASDPVYPAFGLEKMRKMIENTNRYVEEAFANLGNSTRKLAQIAGTHEKEGDWAIAGGLAQGIGGLGAGIAAAADTQLRNMEIRERNAKRDEQAAQLYQAAAQFDQMRPTLKNVNNMLEGWKVSVRESTEELFKLLRISVGRISSMTCDTDLTFSMDYQQPFRIDGYVRMKSFSENGRFLGEDIIPLPVWDKGAASAQLACKVRRNPSSTFGNDVYCKFEPYVLWTISEDPKQENYYTAYRIEDIPGPERESFKEYWHSVETRDIEEKQEEKKRKNRKVIISVLAVCAVIAIAVGISSANTAREKAVRAQQAQEKRIEENRKFAETTIARAERMLKMNYTFWYDCNEMMKDLSSVRSRLGPDADQDSHLIDLYLRFSILSNDKTTAAKIGEEYRNGTITGQQLITYAELIRDYIPERGPNAMVDALPRMFRGLSDVFPDAEKTAGEYEELEEGYREAQNCFDRRDFADALPWFEKHLSYKFSMQYRELCKGAVYWCGTWGNIRIEPAEEKPEYLTATNPETKLEYSEPYRINLIIYEKDSVLDRSKGITTDGQANEDNVHYKMSTPSGLPGIYRFEQKDENTCIYEKYNGTAYNAKKEWSRTLTKTGN